MSMTAMQHRSQVNREAARKRAWADQNGWMVGYLDFKLYASRNPFPAGSRLAGEWQSGYQQAEGERRLMYAAKQIDAEQK